MITEAATTILGSARVPRAGFGVTPKRTPVFFANTFQANIPKGSRLRDAIAHTRDACATQICAIARLNQ
jgi:hypothetical protein